MKLCENSQYYSNLVLYKYHRIWEEKENDSTITYYFEYKEEFIPLIPLAGKDLEIINRIYNVNLGGK